DAVLEAVALRHRIKGNLLPYRPQQGLALARYSGSVFGMQAEIEEREFELTQHLHARLEVARRQQALQRGRRQWLAAVDMTRDQWQGLALPAPVLHELAGQL